MVQHFHHFWDSFTTLSYQLWNPYNHEHQTIKDLFFLISAEIFLFLVLINTETYRTSTANLSSHEKICKPFLNLQYLELQKIYQLIHVLIRKLTTLKWKFQLDTKKLKKIDLDLTSHTICFVIKQVKV